jgi:cellulose synthase/poly-beta-1,6-N-acetylglucosamine synthase-like glycosyltransferase
MIALSVFILVYITLSALSYGTLLLNYWSGIKKLYNPLLNKERQSIFISIVVCFRNEEKQIETLLESLFNQDFPPSNFEILLYNDASTDGSLAIVKSMQAKFKNHQLTCRDVPFQAGVNSPKKLAIEHASNNSKANLMIVTDADCTLNKNWLALMAQCYLQNKAVMITAPVAITKAGGFINELQSIEMEALMAVTAGSFGNKAGIMCNGANLAFDRNKFLELTPYKSNLHISSGDDMFLMMAMQKENNNNIHFLAHQDALVFTKAQSNINDYVNQRIRWASKSKNYKNYSVQLVAILVLNFNLVILLSPFMIISFGRFLGTIFFLSLLVFKFGVESIILRRYTKIVQTKVNYIKLFLYQYLEAIFTIQIALKSIKGSYVWKDRKQHF